MTAKSPPTLDPVALESFKTTLNSKQPIWLHEEVSNRMCQRLEWFKEKPASLIDWEPLNGGLKGHLNLQRIYPSANFTIMEHNEERLKDARAQLSRSWLAGLMEFGGIKGLLSVVKDLKISRRGKQNFIINPLNTHANDANPPPLKVNLIWANMLLHLVPNPVELIKEWHKSLEVGGWVMFSCLGPDTTKELRSLYERLGWPEPSHHFTDMHDWGDMLVEAGFSDPVMDMERITLTYTSPEALIKELRTLGKNFHSKRFANLRGRKWLESLKTNLLTLNTNRDSSSGPTLPLTFEIIYGHAFKVAPKVKVAPTSSFSTDDFKAMLKR